MKRTLYILVALILLTNCNNSSNNETETVQTKQLTLYDETETVHTKQLTLYDLKKDFTFFNLTKFEMDTFNWETRQGKYKELDSITFYTVWQDGKRKFTGEYYDRYYLFSWQDRDTNFIEFTILAQEEDSWCNIIYYFIFDKNGKFIDNFYVCSSCGDGGWVFYASGKFINNKTYEMSCIEYEDPLLEEEFREGDSTLYHITINDKGKVTKKEIFNKHFTEKW